tara:strand:- start:209 stop:550 length:342 start_codon:yes stop_codon:yes gene_type:complete
MIVPNILFKVISNNPIKETMVVKYCRENAQKPIDEYKSYNVSYFNLDFTSPESLIESIKSVGTSIVIRQLNSEPILDQNKSDHLIHTVDLNEYVGKIVSVKLDPTGDLNEIEL